MRLLSSEFNIAIGKSVCDSVSDYSIWDLSVGTRSANARDSEICYGLDRKHKEDRSMDEAKK